VAVSGPTGQAATVSEEFRIRSAQVTLAGLSAIVALIGLGMLASPGVRVPGAILVVFWSFIAIRALRTSCVVVRADEVETRSLLRARRHRFADLRRVEVGLRRTGLNGSSREYLIFQAADGRQFAFMEMNSKPPKGPDEESVIRRAAAYINDQLSEPPRF
jgi:hypothetical protein